MNQQVVVVTGAGSGIGKAIALTWGARGAKLVLAGRNQESLQVVAKAIQDMGAEALVVPTDVRVKEACSNLISQTIHHFGQLDVLINNAGISMRALYKDLDLEVIETLMQVNFWGTAYCAYYALPHLLKSRGSLVGISSVAGYQALPARSGYCASKFAMHGLLNTLRVENKRAGLHVLICCPGFTASNIRKTALNAQGQMQGESPRNEANMMQPEEVAKALYQACKNRKRMLLLGNQAKLTWQLSRFFPAFLDAQVLKHFEKESGSPIQQTQP